MELLISNLNLHEWHERWEAMQSCYVPQRLHRFDLMLRLPSFAKEAEVEILDLGCGFGSVAFRALEHYPNARILAVDLDPVTLTMGKRLAEGATDRIEFVQADIRGAGFWEPYESTFDLIVSATTLHWLNAEHLAETFRRAHRALKPGGWFMNSDHIASDDPEMQPVYRELAREKQREAFRAAGAEGWDDFWKNLGRAVGRTDLLELRNADEYWEGSDGQPKQLHISALKAAGFEAVQVHWQDLADAVIGARKAPAP